MELSVILNYILGSTSIVSIVLFFVFFKANKKLKKNEVSQSDTKTQSEQINLGMQFIEQSARSVELIQQATQNTDTKIDALSQRIELKMTNMTRNQTSMNKKLKLIEQYLNGGFRQYVEDQKTAKK